MTRELQQAAIGSPMPPTDQQKLDGARWAQVQVERNNWSAAFGAELKRLDRPDWKKFSSYWWEDYYREMTSTMRDLMSAHDRPNVLEIGSGSGKATLLLPDEWPKMLLDISSEALTFARSLAVRLNRPVPSCVEGDAFRSPFRASSFSLVWNIGMVEHYDEQGVRALLAEMIRVCRQGGVVAFGVPMAWSGPIIKARILSWPLLRQLPGYKADTEIWYTKQILQALFARAALDNRVELNTLRVSKIGSVLPMETPAPLVRFSQERLPKALIPLKFLSLISARIVK